MSETIIIDSAISDEQLRKLAELRFGDMVKGVIDIDTGELALGGELHADQETILINKGNQQENLWGINVYIDEPFPDNIEFDSMINIRPSQNNNNRTVEDPVIQDKILGILKGLLP